MKPASDLPVRRRYPPEWNSVWLVALFEWRRWRRLGLSRWATFCVLLTSLHRLQ